MHLSIRTCPKIDIEWSGLQFWHNTGQIVVTSSCLLSQGRPVSTGEGHSFVGFCLFVKRIGETAPGAGVASVNLALHLERAGVLPLTGAYFCHFKEYVVTSQLAECKHFVIVSHGYIENHKVY